MRRRILSLVIAVIAGLVPLAASISPASADPVSDLLGMVNNLRSTLGVAALVTDPTLTSVAQQWSQQMASTGTLAHNPNLNTQILPGWTKTGENAGTGASLAGIFSALSLSPGHYANMVDPTFNLTGVGVAADSAGTLWITEDFEALPAPTFTRPLNAATNVDTLSPFTWASVPGAQYYYLYVTTQPALGGNVLVNSGTLLATQTSYQVPSLPTGQTLWARIYGYVSGRWTGFSDVSFTAAPSQVATFTRPTVGATNVDTTRPFSWAGVPAAQYYYLFVTTLEGGGDYLVNSGTLLSTQTSYQVPALPTGKTLWARVYTYFGGKWAGFSDVSFTAAARS